ncbi:MAG: leucyl/phenylalanyl-tRNA--protein transferase [Vulcanimicrobiota bacterium]
MDPGLVMITPTLSQETLLRAYGSGCFPWSGRPARWYCPDPRAVFEWDRIHFSRRLMRTIRQEVFRVTFDQAFAQVITACAKLHPGSWIDRDIVEQYVAFHRQGFAHSVEAWVGEELVGGLYGVQIRRMFAGESMFHTRKDASKVAFYHLVQHLQRLGVELFDAQVLNPHTISLGATEIPREEFLARLRQALAGPGDWAVNWTSL